VCAQVPDEASLLSERLGAYVAAVGLLARVCAQVPGEDALLIECHGAYVAAVWLLARVCAQEARSLGHSTLGWRRTLCH